MQNSNINWRISAQKELLITELSDVVGMEHCLVDAELCSSYETDWSRRWQGRAMLVVRPADRDEVIRVLEICSRYRLAIVAQGGNTGMVGASVPRSGEILLNLRRLNLIGNVDPISRQVTVGAGATLDAVNAACAAYGLRVAVDLASRGSATIGGMIATNAGGIHALRYGSMRSQVMGIEAVLPDGKCISHLVGLRKDNTGYDLGGLLSGSEGTLAVITAARLQLVPIPRHRVVALVAIDPLKPVKPGSGGDIHESWHDGLAEEEMSKQLQELAAPAAEAGIEMLSMALSRIDCLEAAEIMFDYGFELTRAYAHMNTPFTKRYPAYVLLECAGAVDVSEVLGDIVSNDDSAVECAVGTDRRNIGALWAYRDKHTEAIAALGVAHKMDVSVPLNRFGEFVGRLTGVVEAVDPIATLVMFGHLGDGNLHVNVVGPNAEDESVDDRVLELAAHMGGSISAEHGVGIAKRRHLARVRSQAEIGLMVAIKNTFDPLGIMNPGVVFSAGNSAWD